MVGKGWDQGADELKTDEREAIEAEWGVVGQLDVDGEASKAGSQAFLLRASCGDGA